MFGRTTIFTAILSAVIVAVALVAEATQFGRETLTFALVLFSVVLFIGVATFVRAVAINYEDARWSPSSPARSRVTCPRCWAADWWWT